MKIIRTVLGDTYPLTDEFEFDDGIIIKLKHDSKWIFRTIEVFAEDTIQESTCTFYISIMLSNGRVKASVRQGSNDWRYADYIYYIITCHLSFVRYYPSVNEWFDVYSTQYEYHNLLDIKHRCRNLRKAGKFSWAHYNILRNMQEYVEYARVSRFCRESLLNFYTRFIKLSVLKNNKHLSWIIDETDTFIHYGFVMPMKDDNKSIRCGCKKCPNFGTGCPIDEEAKGLEIAFTYVGSDEADSYEQTKITCQFKIPNTKDDERQCDHQQYYLPKSRYNKRVGVRQQTKEFVKMQLTDDQVFEINGVASYPLYEKYGDRMIVKSKSLNSFLIMMRYLYNASTFTIPTEPNTDPNQDIVLTMETIKDPLTNELMDIAVRYLIHNKSNLYGFVMNGELNDNMIKDLYQISIERSECQNGPLKRLKDLMQQRKLMMA